MNLKDRLGNYNKINTNIEQNDEFTINNMNEADIFENNTAANLLILNLLNKNKNIIFASLECENNPVIANYLHSVLNENSNITRDIENIDSENSKICIIPTLKIEEAAKLFESFLTTQKSYIMGINLKSFDNIIEKLKVIIALNHKNLTEQNINTLLSSSDLIFIFISRNEDGLYYISEIKELIYSNEEFSLEILYIYKNRIEEESNKNEISIEMLPANEVKTDEKRFDEYIIKENNTEDTEIKNTPDIYIEKNELEEEIKNQKETIIISETEENNTDKEQNEELSTQKVKINKYKILKEKIKNKNK